MQRYGRQRVTLTRYLNQAVHENPNLYDLEFLLAVQMACKSISSMLHLAGLVYSIERESEDYTDGRFYSMERLDHLSTIVLRNALRYTGKCEVIDPNIYLDGDEERESEHQPGVLIAKSFDSNYVAVLDPLDGSGNADASLCTGSVFGVFESSAAADDPSLSPRERARNLIEGVLQPGQKMLAAGYCLYSSATVLVFTLGDNVQGFTLDPQINEFVLTHPNLTIPDRGTVYSCNEANSEGWTEEYRQYLRNLKLGQGETGQRYAHRYVGSMVGDLHRTLLYGGIFGYPADSIAHPEGHLQLLYKSSPMAFVLERAGGRAIDGRGHSLLEVKPDRVHQKVPCFMGSPGDVAELESYLS